MPASSPARAFTRAERHRFVARGLLRAAVITAAIVVLYFLTPQTGIGDLPLGVALVAGPLLWLGVAIWQILAISRSPHPLLRAIESLTITMSLYLLLFAATYWLVARADPTSFTVDTLTRVDALYFTTTVFSSVGFGDITPASQSARALVTIQMILNVLLLGAGIRLLMGVVERRRESGEDRA